MYTFSSKLKTLALAFIILGALGVGYGFLTAPKTVDDVKAMLHADDSHGGGHETTDTHGDANEHAATEEHSENSAHESENTHEDGVVEKDTTHTEETSHENVSKNDSTAHKSEVVDSVKNHANEVANHIADTLHAVTSEPVADSTHHDEETTHTTASTHAENNHGSGGHEEGRGMSEEEHLEHALTFAKNRPFTAIYVPMLFFLFVSLCAFVYYCVQRASTAGWSPVLFRVMEGVSAYIVPGSIIVLVFILYSSLGHGNHLFAWMFTSIDPSAPNYDFAMEVKDWWLNIPGFAVRAVIYVVIWILFRHFIIKNSRAQDEASDLTHYKKNFNLSVIFLVVFLTTELFMVFDWIMSIDHHWFSQLFPFYVFASMFVSAITVITFVALYLRAKGYLPFVNDSHLHDLAKYMFAFSIFWTYFFYAQFMLQWYANIPEETAYFYPRLVGNYQPLFIGMLIMNFVFPILVLMNSDYKRMPWFIVIAGLFVLAGHYLDLYVMIAPGTIGNNWHFGIPEIGGILLFLGLFIFVVFNALTKAPLLAKGNPLLKESEIFHY